MKPQISVIIPSFNEEKLLPACLASLKNQTFPKEKFEIIVIDNNSTDATAKIAQAAGVAVYTYTEKQGVSAARQFGVKKAKAELIAFTDSDINVTMDWLSKIAKNMNNEDILCLGGSVWPDTKNPVHFFLFRLYDFFLRFHVMLGKVLPWGSNMAVRKSSLIAVGGFDPEILSAEDWDISLRIQKKFGVRASKYDPSLKVYTSTRKQDDLRIFLRYFWRGIITYINFILLGRRKLSRMITVR